MLHNKCNTKIRQSANPLFEYPYIIMLQININVNDTNEKVLSHLKTQN